MRITNHNVKIMFQRYISALKALGQATDTLALDNYPLCGGYKLVSRDSRGAECDVLCSKRLSTREMYYALVIASQTLEAIIYKKEAA